MRSAIHFDPRACNSVVGGVVVSFDDTRAPTHAEVIETAAVVTITLYADRPLPKRFGRFNRHEVFIPLAGPLSCRTLIDGSQAHEPRMAPAA